MKVKVENFQSIKNAEIEVDGFTVITGANNSGKTALIRALRGAFQNTAGNTFVRHGEDNCRVEVDLGDVEFAWEKGKKKPTYEVGSKTLNPGRDVPKEVSDLGVRSITAGGREIWPQIANQFSGQVFLVDQPGSVLAEAVADVERVGKLNRALKSADKDKRAASSELKVRRKDLKQYEEDLEAFDGVDDVEGLVTLCESLTTKIEKIDNWKMGLSNLRDRHNAASEIVESLSGVREDFTEFEEADNLSEMAALVTEIKELKTLKSKWKSSSEDLTQSQQALNSVGVLDIPTMDTLKKLVKALTSFESLRSQWVVSTDQVSSLASDIEQAEQDLKTLDKEIKDTLGEVGECPMCGVSHSDGSSHHSVLEMGGA